MTHVIKKRAGRKERTRLFKAAETVRLKDSEVGKSLAGVWICSNASVAGTGCFQGGQHKKGGEVGWVGHAGPSCPCLGNWIKQLEGWRSIQWNRKTRN